VEPVSAGFAAVARAPGGDLMSVATFGGIYDANYDDENYDEN